MTRIRVAVVVGEHLTRAGIVALLSAEPDFQVVADSADLPTALAQWSSRQPDVVLLDCHLVGPDRPGLATVTGHLSRSVPGSRVVLMGSACADRSLDAAVGAVAAGYVARSWPPQAFFAALRQAVDRSERAPLQSATVVDAAAPVPLRIAAAVDDLTPREREVIRLVCQGLNNRQISCLLQISPNTVKIHLRNILAKLHLANRVQVAALVHPYPSWPDWPQAAYGDA